jgi:hypothetical protein
MTLTSQRVAEILQDRVKAKKGVKMAIKECKHQYSTLATCVIVREGPIILNSAATAQFT